MPPESDPNELTAIDDRVSAKTKLKQPSSNSSLVGATIGGRYLIESVLGRGGMGAVYLARDKPEMMSRRVVVKVLLEDSLKNAWVVQKFQQEIESLTKIDDPGVVAIFDAGTLDDGAPYLVMQFVDGDSLRSQIKQGGLDLIRSAGIMRQIGRTLQSAHDEGIIHRDLKPENIMLRRTTSGGEQVKVIDFGIAKVKNSVIAPSTVTGEGAAGTIGYMPPEQLQAKTITPAADIYALGAIAYELVTGTRPFNPETGFELLEMQRRGVRVRPKDLRPAISEKAQQVILRALAFDPKVRYQSAAEFGDALADALTAEPDELEATTVDMDGAGTLPMPISTAPSMPEVVTSGAGQRKAMELAHVLFVDIVGYTRLPIDLQTKTMDRLNQILRGTEDFARSEASDQLLRLPSGDGMALVFFGDAEAPARCALAVGKALRSHPDIKLRMGVHTGPVDPIVDVNGIAIVTGAGINTAQRVMDCGDTGHILLSKRIADDLGQYSRWRDHLHDLGETTVKHEERLHLVNLYTDEAGNPAIPEKLKKKRAAKLPIGLIAVVALAIVVLGGALLLWHPWNRSGPIPNTNSNSNGTVVPPAAAARAFTYYLTRSDKGKSVEEDRFVGNELFHNGDQFVFVMVPEQSGSLYLLDRSSTEGQPDSWYVLFPTPKKNGGSAFVVAQQKALVDLFFGATPADENLTLIWSAQPIPDLEAIFQDAANHGFKITDPDQMAKVKGFLAQHNSPEPKVDVDTSKIETKVSGSGDVVLRSFVLKHRKLQ